MRDAVTKLKAALGAEAVIVGTRRVQDPEGGFVEIHATAAPEAPSATAHAPAEEGAAALGGLLGAAAAYRRTAGAPATAMAPRPAPRIETAPPPVAPRPVPLDPVAPLAAPLPVPSPGGSVESLRQDVAALRDMVSVLAARMGARSDGAEAAPSRPLAMPGRDNQDEDGDRYQVRALQDALQRAGLTASHARDVAWRAQRERPGCTPDDAETLERLGGSFMKELRCTGDLLGAGATQRRVLAFVGPTGVGKTTTIGKVAAHAALLRGIPTALVTVDTYRLAAIEQLARYADILESPLRVVRDPEDLPGTIAELSDRRLVLVDTTGRNPRYADQVNALARYFPQGWGGELVLTVAANVRERDLFAAVDAFERLGVRYLCATKMDETDAPGVLYSLARRAGRPLTWLTNGQRVPEDIEVASPEAIAERITQKVSGHAMMAAVG
jgi:flagellar biosynthesis protein FlhF